MIDINRQPLAANAINSQLLEFLKKYVPKIISMRNSLTIGSFKHDEASNKILEQISW